MNFEHITSKHPSERDAIERLKGLLEKHSGSRAEYTLNRLYDLLRPNSREELALALGDLIREGSIKQVVRIVSPKTGGGIKDYQSLDEVPNTVHDWRSDTDIEVRPDDLQFIYVVPTK